jgi:hypothetical protein
MKSRLPMRPAKLVRCLIPWSLVVGLLTAFAQSGWGASGGPNYLPTGPLPGQKPPKPSGLSLTIDSGWLAGNGYRPVRITIAPLTPLTADRTLMIRISPFETWNYYQHNADLGVTQQFDIPAQSNGISGTIAVPQYGPWGRLKLDVFEDGEPVEDLSREDVYLNAEASALNGTTSINGVSNAVNIGRSPSVLQIGGSDDQGNLSAFFQIGFSPWSWLCVETQNASSALTAASILQLAAQPQLPSIADLPERWLDHSGVDIFFIPFPKLQELIAKQPRRWAAIRFAVAAGANLWVYDVGDRFERLAELEKAVDLYPDSSAEGAGQADGALDAAGWDAPDRRMQTPEVGPQEIAADDPPKTKKQLSPKPNRRTMPFLTRSLGSGQIAAIATSRPNADQFNWTWLLNTAGTRRLSWTSRHGMLLAPDELMENQSDFWEFLIPGVGLTPVVQFQILISLFVIGIGPVNYFFLRRWRRLGLLLITVPASAGIVTLALFGYALIHDGLGVRVRARSFTQLDLRRGEAVCWTRLSYYAGLSPSQGLTFPGDVAVYPFGQEPQSPYRGGERRPKEIAWQEAESRAKGALPNQHFSTDWLPARTPTQFITVRSRKTTATFGITQSAPGTRPKLENHLGTRIKSLVLTDAAGKYFGANELESEAAATLIPLAADQAMKGIQQSVADNNLQLPGGAQVNWFQQSNSYYPRRGNYNSTPSPPTGRSFEITNSGPTPQHDSVLERSLREWTQSLEPRTFVAVVEQSPEVVVGLDSAREEASLHVVVGNW